METQQKFEAIPKKIKSAEYLVYASLVVGLLKSFLYETMTAQKMLSDQKSLIIGVLTVLIIGFFGFKVGQGRNWARIVLLVFFAIGMIPYPFIVMGELQMNLFIGIVSIIQMAIQLYALIILFSGDSKQWFKEQKLKLPPTP